MSTKTSSSTILVLLSYNFYSKQVAATSPPPVMPSGLSIRLWAPSWSKIPPRPIRTAVHWVWWLFHNLNVFANSDFAVVLIEREGRLMHRSGVFPAFFRFPFMAPDDLQIGDTWTHPDARGAGLAGLAIQAAMSAFGNPLRRFWYVVEETNFASIRVIEKQGFALAGRGARVSRLGLAALGYYFLDPKMGGNSEPLPNESRS